jgi:transglutaminase-like putative cysteine protease
MHIRCGHEVIFDLPGAAPVLLMLYTHPSRASNLVGPEALFIEPHLSIQTHLDAFGNRCARIVAPKGPLRIFNDFTIADSGAADPVHAGAQQHSVCEVPPDVLPFLLSSRYCEVDRLSHAATLLFGSTSTGWPRVQAICDWVHSNIHFGYPFARPTKTAFDVFNERTGVCRDFTHLAVTFCRCMGIPARYCTGYLGDIGIPPMPAAMDFSAWFEVYLGHQWHTFDARFNTPRIGRVLMARGRDAVDVALTTSFGHANLKSFRVWADEVKL